LKTSIEIWKAYKPDSIDHHSSDLMKDKIVMTKHTFDDAERWVEENGKIGEIYYFIKTYGGSN
jgi:hypothetical protein